MGKKKTYIFFINSNSRPIKKIIMSMADQFSFVSRRRNTTNIPTKSMYVFGKKKKKEKSKYIN